MRRSSESQYPESPWYLPNWTRRQWLAAATGATLLGGGLVAAIVHGIEWANSAAEIKPGSLPGPAGMHYYTEDALTRGWVGTVLSHGPLETPSKPTSHPELWRAASVSLWRGLGEYADQTVSGGSLVEYAEKQYGILTSVDAVNRLTSHDQAYAFIPGLEIAAVKEAEARANPLNDESDIAAAESPAFQRIDLEAFQPYQGENTCLLPLTGAVARAIEQARAQGYLTPLQIAPQALRTGILVGGARFDRGTDTQYQVDQVTADTFRLAWHDPHYEDNGGVSLADESHFAANRPGDAIVTLGIDGGLEPHLVGLVGSAVTETIYHRYSKGGVTDIPTVREMIGIRVA